MSVRHLFGALQWVTTGSVAGRPRDIEERVELNGLSVGPKDCGHVVGVVNPHQITEEPCDSLEGRSEGEHDHQILMDSTRENCVNGNDNVPVHCGEKQSTYKRGGGFNNEQVLLQWKLRQFDQLSAKIEANMARYRQSGDRRRLNEMEKELQVIRILRGSAVRCLKDVDNANSQTSESGAQSPGGVSPSPVLSASPSESASHPADSVSDNCVFDTRAPVENGLFQTPLAAPSGFPSGATATDSVLNEATPVPSMGVSAPPVPLAPQSRESCKADSDDAVHAQDALQQPKSYDTRCPRRPEHPAATAVNNSIRKQGIHPAGSHSASPVNRFSSAGGNSEGRGPTTREGSPTVQSFMHPRGSVGQTPTAAAVQNKKPKEWHGDYFEPCDIGGGESTLRDKARRASAIATPTSEVIDSAAYRGSSGTQSSASAVVHEMFNRLKNRGSHLHGKVAPPAAPIVLRSEAAAEVSDGLSSAAQAVSVLRKRGNDLVKKGQYKEAIQVYTDAIRCDPENNVLLCNRAVAYLLNNQYRLSLMDCENVLYNSPTNLKAHWRAAKALLYMYRTKEARYHYRKASELSTNAADERLIADELELLHSVEMYHSCSKEKHWSKCLWHAKQLLQTFSHISPINIPWHCLKLEALLHLDCWKALEGVKQLKKSHPTCAELFFLHAKSLFYCAHNQRSVAEALELVRHAVELKKADGEVEDSRYIALERNLTLFERCRDRGNAAYKSGNWSEAYDAYTSCISIDPQNTSLVAMAYCNRAATCMQCGRWAEALEDVNNSIGINGTAPKAYTRRAHINIHLFSEKGGTDIRLLKQAVSDLRTVVKLEPSKANKQHLDEVVRMTQEKEKQIQRAHNDNCNRYGSGSERHDWRGKGHQKHSSSPGAQHKAEGQDNRRPSVATASHSRAQLVRLLGLETTANLDEQALVRAYHKAALQWHPDRWVGAPKHEQQVAEQKFKEINVAYQALKQVIGNR